jgi:hypothetical protein
MSIKKDSDVGRGPGAIAAASLLGAAAASLCCILPLILFGLGVSGAWISTDAAGAVPAVRPCGDRRMSRLRLLAGLSFLEGRVCRERGMQQAVAGPPD